MVINMGYYDEYLEHGNRAWKKHKYITREFKNGGWQYTYKLGDLKSENGFTYTDSKGHSYINDHRIGDYEKRRKDAINSLSNEGGSFEFYAGRRYSPIEAVRDSYVNNTKKGDMKKAQEDAKVLRKLKEETPKAKLGNAILKIRNAETLLKTKLKDIFK